MKISYNWLKSIIPIDLPADEVSKLLTDIGLEVEKQFSYSSIDGGLEGLIIGEVKSVSQHPNADRLKITSVNVGEQEPYQIICGAPNVDKGQKVVVALPGTTIHPINGVSFKIKKAKIRGEVSCGMICAEDEIGLGSDHDGILVLEETVNVGVLAKDYFKIENDDIFEIGLTPNRADAMGHFGVARDLLVALKFKNIVPESLILKPFNSEHFQKNNSNFIIEVQSTKDCPRYSGQLISGIKIDESPQWLKNKLKAIGLNPINNIVDITNYVLHDIGHPLHAFDLSQIDGNKIIVKKADHNSSFTTLDGIKRILDENDLMICNANKPMCIAGVFGGLESGVTEKTSSVFIESAYFNPHTIRKSAKRHGLNTDASFRFERGVDPEMTLLALQKAVDLILEIAGGEIASSIIDHYPEPIQEKVFEISFSKINSLCGTSLPGNEMLRILNYLEIKIITQSDSTATVQVPSYRVDIEREVDVAEEILRIYGFNSVDEPSKMNSSINFNNELNGHFIKNKISNSLVHLGLTEILSNSLTSKTYVTNGAPSAFNEDEHVELLNPLSGDTAVMRQSLVFNALEVVNFNHKNGEQNIRIFEFGKSYKKINNEFLEQEHLVLALAGLQNEEHWFNSKSAVSYFQLNGIISHVLETLGLKKRAHYSTSKNTIFEEGMSVSIDKELVIELGMVSAQLKTTIGIKDAVYIANIYWDKLFNKVSGNDVKFKPIVKYPKVNRDLSLLIDNSVSFEHLKNAALKSNKSILKDVHLFDIYKGKSTGDDKKSYALRFELQHKEHTLTEKEIDAVMQTIQSNFAKQFNATLR